MRIVRVGPRRFVIGLWWQVAEGRKDRRQQANEANTATGNTYTRCVLLERQIALGETLRGAGGLPSLAAAIARENAAPRCIICHFAAEGCWWVCAVKDGLVAAEGDRVCPSEEDALRHADELRQMLALPLAEQVCDPDNLLPAPSLPRRAAALLMPYAPLRPLAPPCRMLRRVGIALLVLLGALLFKSIDSFRTDSDISLFLEARRAELLAHPERHFPRPWLEQPPVEDWGAACLTGILGVPLSDQGWDVHEAVCNGKTLTLKWKFSSSASFLHLPEGATLLTPTTAQREVTLNALPPAQARPLVTRDEVSRTLYELARVLGLHLNLAWKDKARREVREAQLAVTLTAPWYAGEFSVDAVPSMTVMDRDLYRALGSIPGIVLTSLTLADGVWKITGLCHGI